MIFRIKYYTIFFEKGQEAGAKKPEGVPPVRHKKPRTQRVRPGRGYRELTGP